jgi:hypothetical protein
MALDSLGHYSTRNPGDLRSRLLQAYVTKAEERRATAMRP